RVIRVEEAGDDGPGRADVVDQGAQVGGRGARRVGRDGARGPVEDADPTGLREGQVLDAVVVEVARGEAARLREGGQVAGLSENRVGQGVLRDAGQHPQLRDVGAISRTCRDDDVEVPVGRTTPGGGAEVGDGQPHDQHVVAGLDG